MGDTDDSGTLSLEEFKSAMAKHPEIPEARVQHIFDTMDWSHNGQVDYTAFIAATLSSQKTLNGSKSLAAAFAVLDHDNDGWITTHDLDRAFEGKLSRPSISKMVKDSSANGRIGFGSFKNLMIARQQKEPDSDSAEDIRCIISMDWV